MTSKEFFARLIGADSGSEVTPYPYQQRTAEALARGDNLVLRAPTGAGKTWAALLAFLEAKWRDGQPHADRVIYAVPLRSLANGLWESTLSGTRRAFGPDRVSEEPRQPGQRTGKLHITLQTGEEPRDPFFTGDICFTTVDQLLASYLNLPYSLGGQRNINAGALIGALLVFDEIHLLEVDRALATTIDVCRRLQGLTQTLMMTATLSGDLLQRLAQATNSQIEEVTQDELALMPAHRNKQRRYRWVDKPLTAEQVWATHAGGRSIAICNTVGAAQRLYAELKTLAQGTPTRLLLLHSRFYPEDRRRVEAQLNEYFGPRAAASDAILVATQVVEAGIDISADNLHTEEAPANAIVQRAGRVARYADRNTGVVWVHALDTDDKGKSRFGPYVDSAELVEATGEALAALGSEGAVLGFLEETELVRQVHERVEGDAFRALLQRSAEWSRSVAQAMDEGDQFKLRQLVRDIDNVSVLLAEAPETVDLSQRPELLSVPRSSLHGLRSLLASEHKGWLAKIPERVEDGVEESTAGAGLRLRWREETDFSSLERSAWLIALSPAAASYDSEIGLQLGRPASVPWPPLNYRGPLLRPTYAYACESFSAHALRAREAMLSILEDCPVGRHRVAALAGLEESAVTDLGEFLAALHDVGKLAAGTQEPLRAWQAEKDPVALAALKGEPLAHSTFDPTAGDAERQRDSRFRRAPHAAEGAYAVWFLLESWLGPKLEQAGWADLLLAGCSAIARHHSAEAGVPRPFRFIPDAPRWVRQVLSTVSARIGAVPDKPELVCLQREDESRTFGEQLVRAQVSRGEEVLLPLYWFFVRSLRLADQAATSEISTVRAVERR